MKPSNAGRVHSVESFGTVDGPGIRMVVFLQGCPFRCRFCHNPDTWSPEGGTEMTVEELLSAYERNRSFYKKGGLTVSGGEPLLQLPFLTALFAEAKKRSISTCLDTAGASYRSDCRTEYEELLSHTDLVLLDFKHSDPEGHQKLTGCSNAAPLAFATLLREQKIPMVIRHVLVPGITDTPEQLSGIGRLMRQFDNIVGLEVLPYHTMGIAKYQALGIPYSLTELPALTPADASRAKAVILAAYHREKGL